MTVTRRSSIYSRRTNMSWRMIVALVIAVAIVLFSVGWRPVDSAQGRTGNLTIGMLPLPSDPDDQLTSWAELVLAGRCMQAQGYDFSVDWVIDRSRPEFGDNPFGADDVQLAQKVGYGIGSTHRAADSSRQQQDPNRAYIASLSARQQRDFTRALFGDGTDAIEVPAGHGSIISTNRNGCLSAARRELYGDLDQWVALDVRASNLEVEVAERVLTSQEYRNVLAKWRSCMTDLGYPADDPQASRQAVAKIYQSQPYEQAWPVERARAVADATCVGRTGLLMVAKREHQAISQLSEFATAETQDYQARKARAVHRARELLTELTR